MKILILNWRDIKHPLAGGAEISLLEHAKYWQRQNNEVIWFSSSFHGYKSEEKINGIKYIRRGSTYTVHLWAFIYYIKNKFGYPDLVIDNFHFIPFFTPLYMKNNKIIALVNEIAGNLWFENLPYLFAMFGYYIEPLFFKFYKKKHFIVASKSTFEDLQKIGILKNSISIVHNGLTKYTVNKSIVKEKSIKILFLGRISRDKGIADVFEAFKLIKKEIKNAQLWIIGKEEKKGILNSLFKTYGFKSSDKNIHYFGFVDEKKKFELLRRAHILIHPSRKEGWGLTVIEAASQGTPTVGYNVPGLRDSIVNGKTGLLTDVNAMSLSDGVIFLLKNKREYLRLSREAIRWSCKFTWEKSVKESWLILKNIK